MDKTPSTDPYSELIRCVVILRLTDTATIGNRISESARTEGVYDVLLTIGRIYEITVRMYYFCLDNFPGLFQYLGKDEDLPPKPV